MTLDEIKAHDGEHGRFAVADSPGVAFYLKGLDTEPDEDTEWSGYEVETGMVQMVMVGDDRVHIIDPEDVSPIADEDYCHGCGQIGCTHDGR